MNTKHEVGNGKRVGRRFIASAVLIAGLLLGPGAVSALAAPPTIPFTRVSSATTTSIVLEAEVTSGGAATQYNFEYDTTPYTEGGGAHGTKVGEGTLKASEPSAIVKALVSGLTPGTVYHFRVVARHGTKEKVESPDRSFATYSPGLGHLPDQRAYEQASPVNKDGGDVTGTVPFVKAAFDGHGVTFGSTSGIPGGQGAQELPTYLAKRSGEGAGGSWDTTGVLPPESLGDRAHVLGWTPDFSRFFETATKSGSPATTALFARPGAGGAPVAITPYVPAAKFAYAGSSADDSETVFESSSAQIGTTPAGSEGRSNVYAWDGSKVALASVLPNGEAAKGAFAGPYEWLKEKTTEGGAANSFYTQDERAVSKDGSVFFTVAGSGHIYERENPTKPESAQVGGKCVPEPNKACTIDVSASQRTPEDPGGVRPRAFQAASADGKTAFFTSPEELTDDANTGPEVEKPVIGRATLGGGAPEEVMGEFLTDHHAVGITVQGEYLYWADTAAGTIGRARLNGNTVEDVQDPYVSQEQIEVEREVEEGVKAQFAAPRYVAVDSEYVYWTNAANNARETGTIGRAKLGATEAEGAEPEFIKGASNPQGIAVNSSHIYWANAFFTEAEFEDDVARADIDGSGAEQRFVNLNSGNEVPYGVALDATHVYFTIEGVLGAAGGGFLERVPLEGGTQEFAGNGGGAPRGIAVDATYAYWVSQGHKEIGRMPLSALHTGPGPTCEGNPTCEPEFLKVSGSPTGLALDGNHLYWSSNGEILPHPGNDLYRYSAEDGSLTDLTPIEPGLAENGAEVQGVIGASKDGSRLYFVANGVFDAAGGATQGNCNGLRRGKEPSGVCNLYLWEEGSTPAGTISFVARLDANGNPANNDATNWLPTDANGVFVNPVERTSRLNADASALLFTSQRKLSAYDNEGVSELYLYRIGQGTTCVSCNPTGAGPGGPPSLGSIQPSALELSGATATSSRNLAAEGGRVFFQTVDALAPEDENGAECQIVGSALQSFLSCLDVYEWEAPGTGACTVGGSNYSPQDEGCLYLISTGKSDWANLFADSSASGNDVFFFSREGLVGQDKDELLDVYDARANGGIAAQNPSPPPVPCETPDACRPAPPPPGEEASPGSSSFYGPGDPQPKRGKHHKKAKHHTKAKHHKKKHRANNKGRASR